MKLKNLSLDLIDKVKENNDIDNVEMLKDDEYAYINQNNKIYYQCPCKNTKNIDLNLNKEEITFDLSYNDFLGSPDFPLLETFKLHSRPQSSRKIYLNFLGGSVTNTWWNEGVSAKINYLPYSYDSNTGNQSSNDLIAIQKIWKYVSEDYAPFDVDITTEFNPAIIYGMICLVTSSDSSIIGEPGIGGIAFLYSWSTSQPCWVFNGGIKPAADSISHEVGHTLGLNHQGTRTQDYYLGNSTWGPIMGVSFYSQISQWTYIPAGKTYTGTNILPSINQDDIAIITKILPFIGDDLANTIEQTDTINPITQSTEIYGMINKNTDVDFLKFISNPGDIIIEGLVAATAPNLNLQLYLYDSSKNLILEGTKNGFNSKINFSVPNSSNGIYYLKIDGIGSTYYTDYGSIGKYKLILNIIEKTNYKYYSINSNKNEIFETEDVTFTVNTLNVLNNTQIYWKNNGTLNSTNIVEPDKGYITIMNNTATIKLTTKENSAGNIKIDLYLNENNNDILASSQNVLVKLYPPPTYNIVSDKYNINVNEKITFTINTTYVKNNTTLYWINEGTLTSDNFVENVNNGLITIQNNTASFSLTVKNNFTNSQEIILISIYKDANFNEQVASSQSVIVNKILSTYLIIPNKTNIYEKETVTFAIKTTNVDDNTTLYWNNMGTLNENNFSQDINSGYVIINNNTATLDLTVGSMNTQTGTIIIYLYKNLLDNDYLTISPIITVTRLPPPTYNIITNKNEVIVGSSIMFTVNTTNVANNTTLFIKNVGESSNTDFVGDRDK